MVNLEYYFDYNATSPLSHSFIGFLASGDVSFLNPSSLHKPGRVARKIINTTTTFIHDFFKLRDSHHLMYTSGATESANYFIKGFFQQDKGRFIYLASDHPCITEQREYLVKRGIECHELSLTEKAEFPYEDLEKALQNSKPGDTLLNFTYVHNELGVHFKLDRIIELKQKYHFKIHLDATQSPGKIENLNNLLGNIEMISFSGHKFSALKGIGIAFINKSFKLPSLILGGGQQFGMRSGTENALGVLSLQYGLKEIQENYQYNKNAELRDYLEQLLETEFSNKIEILSNINSNRASNTALFICKEQKADIVLSFLDSKGIYVGSGSACASGSLKKSAIVKSLRGDQFADRSIRISISPYWSLDTHKDHVDFLVQNLKDIL